MWQIKEVKEDLIVACKLFVTYLQQLMIVRGDFPYACMHTVTVTRLGGLGMSKDHYIWKKRQVTRSYYMITHEIIL